MTGGQDGCGSESESSQTVQSGGFGYNFNSSDGTAAGRGHQPRTGLEGGAVQLAALVRELQRVRAEARQSRAGRAEAVIHLRQGVPNRR